MSYTFSRRDFFKYTALAAVAVAGSSLLTGCSNPNQPSAVYTGTADVKLSFNGSSLLNWSSSDYHILHKGATKDTANNEFSFKFTHYAVSEGTSCSAEYYQLDVIGADGKLYSYNSGSNGVSFTSTNGGAITKLNTEVSSDLTITGVDVSNAKNVYLRYFPRHTALGNINDSYSDVYATWDLTDWVKK